MHAVKKVKQETAWEQDKITGLTSKQRIRPLAQLQLLSFSNSTHDTKCIEITKAGFCEF